MNSKFSIAVAAVIQIFLVVGFGPLLAQGPSGPGGSMGDPIGGPGSFRGHSGFEVEHNMVFPQIAVGRDISTSLVLRSRGNPQYQTWLEPDELHVTGRIYFFHQDGTPMAVSVNGGQEVSEFAFDLAPLALGNFELTSAGDNTAGWALVVVDEKDEEHRWGMMDGQEMYRAEHLDGLVLYTLSEPQGALQSRVGVLPAVFEMQSFIRANLFAQTGPGLNTGVALLNAGEESLHLVLRLYDASGQWTGREESIELAGGHQTALFLDQLFPGLPAEGFRGTLSVEADDTGLVTMALLETDGVLTALPAQHFGGWQAQGMMP